MSIGLALAATNMSVGTRAPTPANAAIAITGIDSVRALGGVPASAVLDPALVGHVVPNAHVAPQDVPAVGRHHRPVGDDEVDVAKRIAVSPEEDERQDSGDGAGGNPDDSTDR